jgi:hypothetical protein
MSVIDPGLTGIVACGLGGISLVVSGVLLVLRIRGSRADQEVAVDPGMIALREGLECLRAEHAAQMASLIHKIDSLEAGSLEEGGRRASEALNDGRLNQSARARALQLLRAGISPDTAANTLGTATRDIRLLAKVSRVRAVR